jgi:hypothetical protein
LTPNGRLEKRIAKAGGDFLENLSLTETNGAFHQAYYVRRIGSQEKLMDAH